MQKWHKIINWFLTRGQCLFVLAAIISGMGCGSSYAQTLTPISTRAFQEALNTNNHLNLYSATNNGGFKLDSSYFSGSATGTTNPLWGQQHQPTALRLAD